MPEFGWVMNVLSALAGAAALWTFQRNFRFVVVDYNLGVSSADDNIDFFVSFDVFNRAKEPTTILDAVLLCLRIVDGGRFPEVTVARRLYVNGEPVERRHSLHPELKPGAAIRLELKECLSLNRSEPPTDQSQYNYSYQLCIAHSQKRKPQIIALNALSREISVFARRFAGQP